MNDFSLKYLVDENTIFKKFCLIWEQVIKNKAPSTRQLEYYAKMKEFIAFNERKELKELSNAKSSQSINLEK